MFSELLEDVHESYYYTTYFPINQQQVYGCSFGLKNEQGGSVGSGGGGSKSNSLVERSLEPINLFKTTGHSFIPSVLDLLSTQRNGFNGLQGFK